MKKKIKKSTNVLKYYSTNDNSEMPDDVTKCIVYRNVISAVLFYFAESDDMTC